MTSTSYSLQFTSRAAKEWRKLDVTVRNQFSARLAERLANPRRRSAALRDLPDCYKIKLRDAGYRLVYRVNDRNVTVMVISVGKRDGGDAYREAKLRLRDLD